MEDMPILDNHSILNFVNCKNRIRDYFSTRRNIEKRTPMSTSKGPPTDHFVAVAEQILNSPLGIGKCSSQSNECLFILLTTNIFHEGIRIMADITWRKYAIKI